MTFQTWSWVYVLAAIPTVMTILRIQRIKTPEARTSRLYYSACLASIVIWTALDLVLTNLPPDQDLVAVLLNRLVFVTVSFVVFLFVTSSIYFTGTPKVSQGVFVASPIAFIVIINFVDSFETSLRPFGWQGDISNPVLRYAWLTLLVIVMAYSFFELIRIRSKVTVPNIRKRLTYFIGGVGSALITGVLAYLVSQAILLPTFSSIVVNLSLLPSYLAFTPARRVD